MNRASIIASACAAALLLPAAAAARPATHHGRAPDRSAVARAASWRSGAARYVPLARTLSGTATVLVHAYNYDGTPIYPGTVGWSVDTGTDAAFGFKDTDATGLATLSPLPAAGTGQGEIVVFPNTGDFWFDVTNLSWPATGTDMGLQPGKVGMQLTAGGKLSPFDTAWVDLNTQNGDAEQLTETPVARVGAAGEATDAAPLALQGTLEGGAVYFWPDQGAELALSGAVSANSTLDSGLSVDQATSPSMVNFTWASGKPGSTAVMSFQNFPVGWVNTMTGASDHPSVPAFRSYSDWQLPPTGDPSAWTKANFTIPITAKPGFDYWISAAHTAGPLTLSEPYQVCSLTPSRTTVGKTGTVIFSGRVPFESGHAKRLIIYRRTTSAGQPAINGGFTSYKGWTRVGTCTTNGSGLYKTRSTFKPGRTSWYVLWYPKDASGHWAAWTSVAKVTVR